MGKLRERMAADLQLRNLRPSTRESYLGCVRKFAGYHMRSPAEMGEKEVRDFLVHLRDDKHLVPSSIKVYVAALKFLYGNTLRRPEVVRPWLQPRVAKKLPVVLSREEVEALLGGVESIKYRAVLMTAYGSVQSAIKAIKMGAFDYLQKPFSGSQVDHVLSKAFEYKRLSNENRVLKKQLSRQDVGFEIKGRTEEMKRLLELVQNIAPTPATVLIQGETGTGSATSHQSSNSPMPLSR